MLDLNYAIERCSIHLRTNLEPRDIFISADSSYWHKVVEQSDKKWSNLLLNLFFLYLLKFGTRECQAVWQRKLARSAPELKLWTESAFYRKNRWSLAYGTDQASDVNKISIIWYSIFRERWSYRIHEQAHLARISCSVHQQLSSKLISNEFVREIEKI